jgi:hypothetical protein
MKLIDHEDTSKIKKHSDLPKKQVPKDLLPKRNEILARLK